jgi:hypothetical protein
VKEALFHGKKSLFPRKKDVCRLKESLFHGKKALFPMRKGLLNINAFFLHTTAETCTRSGLPHSPRARSHARVRAREQVVGVGPAVARARGKNGEGEERVGVAFFRAGHVAERGDLGAGDGPPEVKLRVAVGRTHLRRVVAGVA